MSRMVVPGADTPFITNNSKPNGGVVKLISSASSVITPNQMRLKSRVSASGKNMGTVSSIIDSWSINIPSISSIPNITNNMTTGASSNPVAQLIKPALAPEKASREENVADPNMISSAITHGNLQRALDRRYYVGEG